MFECAKVEKIVKGIWWEPQTRNKKGSDGKLKNQYNDYLLALLLSFHVFLFHSRFKLYDENNFSHESPVMDYDDVARVYA